MATVKGTPVSSTPVKVQAVPSDGTAGIEPLLWQLSCAITVELEKPSRAARNRNPGSTRHVLHKLLKKRVHIFQLPSRNDIGCHPLGDSPGQPTNPAGRPAFELATRCEISILTFRNSGNRTIPSPGKCTIRNSSA
jgi:hypothetical protein